MNGSAGEPATDGADGGSIAKDPEAFLVQELEKIKNGIIYIYLDIKNYT